MASLHVQSGDVLNDGDSSTPLLNFISVDGTSVGKSGKVISDKYGYDMWWHIERSLPTVGRVLPYDARSDTGGRLIFNMVVKKKGQNVFGDEDGPNYAILRMLMGELCDILMDFGIERVVMSACVCEDGLDWNRVSSILRSTLVANGISVYVYSPVLSLYPTIHSQ